MGEVMNSSRMPAGVKVFGFSALRVVPDSALIVVAIFRLAKEPKEAFASARRGAQAVQACLQKAGIKDFGSSRVTLTQEFRLSAGENKSIGYQARIDYSIILRNLDQTEELLAGLIEAGANELTSIVFQTTRLREIRADARRHAITAAREKADIYCSAAGVTAGKVLAIEDVNPGSLSGLEEGNIQQETPAEESGSMKTINQGAITVSAAVNVIYEIGG
jgi:uncharacterized protein YggE